jgi:hypothetical protein
MAAVAVFVILAFGAAFAASGSTRINLSSAASVNGTQLAPGSYKVSWSGEGDNISVTFKSSKTEVKAPAKMAQSDFKTNSTALVTDKSGAITEIHPAGKNTTLQFKTESASTGNASSSTSN